MASVQFLLWKIHREKYSSYGDLKVKQKYKQNLLDEILRDYSTLNADQIVQYREMLLSEVRVLIPVVDLDKAQDLSLNLKKLGAEVVIREMDNACQCENCGTFTVIELLLHPL